MLCAAVSGKRSLLASVLVIGLAGCYVEVKDGPEDAAASDDSAAIGALDEPTPAGAAQCKESSTAPQARGLAAQPPVCFEKPDFQWRSSCKSDACQEVPVFAHYMLTDDLGEGRIVRVEAFDNEHFTGAPVGTVRIANFPARTGGWRQASLFLAPGEYYLRGYLTNSLDAAAVPYSLGGMTLVEGQPVGVVGALSGAEMVRVAPREQARDAAPVHIYLDKMFKRPGSEPDIKAHLRLQLQLAEGVTVTDGKKLLIQLRQGTDLADAPVATFTVATASFLVQGRLGKTEFVSPSLAEGDYLVLAFVDTDDNGFYDAGEPAQLYTQNQAAAAVKIRKDRTVSLPLVLSTDALPE